MTTAALPATAHDLERIARAGLAFDDFVAQAAEVLHRAVPFDGICIGLADPATNLMTRSAKIGLNDVADRTFLFWEYAQPDVAHFRELATRTVGVSILAHETGGDKAISGRFREVVTAEIGAEHEVRGVTRVGGAMWGSYALYRGASRSDFNLAEVDFLHRLETTLAMGLRASTIVSIAAETLVRDSPGPAVLLFDGAGQLVSATATASERLDDLGGGVDGELPVPVTSLVETLRSGDPTASTQIRARARSGRWYALNAAPFAGVAGPAHVAVTIEHATPPQILPLLIAAYGLTDREASIVQAMLRGESTHAIAQSLFLSPYTVQDHFKSIFEKIGVSSRREVATRVFYGQYLDAPVPSL